LSQSFKDTFANPLAKRDKPKVKYSFTCIISMHVNHDKYYVYQ